MPNDDTRPFPILTEYGDKNRSTIPWWLAEEAYKEYKDDQPLEMIAQRGGFGRYELLKLLRREKF